MDHAAQRPTVPTPAELAGRPVVAFDLDGVLRLRDPHGESFTVPILYEADEFPTVFHGVPDWEPGSSELFPTEFSRPGVELLRELVADPRVDVVWASTWQRWSNYYFAGALGIPELPLGVESGSYAEAGYPHCIHGWKTAQLAERFQGRPILFLEDSSPDRYGERLKERVPKDQRHLVEWIQPDSWLGITEDDAQAARSWLSLAAIEGGRGELRSRELASQAAAERREAERRARAALERAQQSRVQSLVRAIWPERDALIRDLGDLARFEDGLTTENVGYALQRAGMATVDEVALSQDLRDPDFHLEWIPEDHRLTQGDWS